MHAGAEDKLNAREPALVLKPEQGTPRAYPLRYLIGHEIVNDTVDGTPVVVTYCPLCNRGLLLDRRAGGQTRTFG